MKRLFILALVLFASVQAMIMGAEKLTDAHIQGHAVEQGTGEHIPFLTVRLLGTSIGTNTDATGHYFLKNIPEGDYVVFEHGPFDYEQENRSVEEKIEQAMSSFDYAGAGCCLDTSPGRIMYFYYNPEQYFKYIRPIRKI